MYPRTHKIEDKQLAKLLKDKNDLVLEGRTAHKEYTEIEEKLKKLDKKAEKIVKAVDVKELDEKGKELAKRSEELREEARKIAEQMVAKREEAIPVELKKEYEELAKRKDECEKIMNRCGLQIQKKKDKIIDKVQKVGKEFLQDEFEDFNTTKLDKNGNVILEVFNWLEEFKHNFRKTQNEKKIAKN